jgi:lysophosphatidylcholine acyltransferase/lyso-PAF acetyltransferase
MGAPSVVAKSSVRKVPFFGKLVDLTQAVYVSREQASSRQNTVQQIKKRALSGEDWPQIYIYPEGTCSNRSCMIQFKSGAFLPGVPVQPVLIKYPNRFDSITWTFDGPQVLKTWWWTMSQFTNYCELEFLPVYTPSEEEKADVSLYANNVRQVMAEAMGVPVTDYVFEDGLEMSKINTLKLSEKLKNIARLRTELKLTSLMEMNIIKNMLSDETFARLTLEEFTVKMNLVGSTPKVVEDLFKLFNLSGEGRIDLREYLIFSVLINPSVRVDRVMPAFFLLYSESRKRMSLDGFTQFMQCIFQVPADEAHILFSAYTPQGDMMDLGNAEVFGRRLKKRLEYIRLYALEATNLLSIYPPRDREINSTRHHPQSQPPHSNVKPKGE